MEIRLGTYRVSENGEQTIKFGKFINEVSFKSLKANVSTLEEFRSNSELHSIFIINFLELSHYFQEAADDLIAKQITTLRNNTPEFRLIYRNSNRLLLNLLSSGRTLVDHLETFLKRKYGKDSAEALRFKAKTAEIFDLNFEYRFIYKLRNYAQHCGFPLTLFTLDTHNKREGDFLRVEVLFKPLFKRDELLSKYKEWGPAKSGLESQEESFPVMWTIGGYYECMDAIVNEFESIELPNILVTYLEMKHFLGQYGELSEGTEPCVFYDFHLPDPSSYENSTFANDTIPLDIFFELEGKLKDAGLI